MAHPKCLNSSQFPPLSLLYQLCYCCFLSVRQHSPRQKARDIFPLVRDKHNEEEGITSFKEAHGEGIQKHLYPSCYRVKVLREIICT